MNIYPTRVEVENIGPFRGKHALELTDSVYAVLAVHEHNPERSNWLGKSTLLWCVAYALFGDHPAKTDNEWVTNGEPEGTVKLTLSDGTVVKRTKPRDKTVQLEVVLPGMKMQAQKAGQVALQAHLGLTKDDFMATCFYEQKRLARLVSAQSADRIAIVESWLAEDLKPIQAMHASAQADLVATTKKLTANATEREQLATTMAQLMDDYQLSRNAPVVDSMTGILEQNVAALGVAAKALEVAKAARLSAESWAAKVEAAEEFEDISEQGAELRAEYDAFPADLAAQEANARDWLIGLTGEAQVAQAQCDQASASKRGEFDGVCPVNGCNCPSSEWVLEHCVSAKEAKRRVTVLAAAKKALSDATAGVAELNRRLIRRAELEGKLEALREQAATLLDAANEVAACDNPPDVAALDKAVIDAESAHSEADAAVQEAKTDLDWVNQSIARNKALQKELTALNEERALRAEAVQLLSKTGVQQKLGELALAHVEVGANSLLQSAGIALNVQVRWVTHLQGLAKHCDQCGAAYPSSARVKACTHCGAQRGPNVAAKLVIELSNRSGAAEDLAGVAVGLAASQWLRNKRASGWSSVFIDEPFGALDNHNKKALSVHVATLLKRSFSSAFVVAHDKSVLDALPSRITIVGTDQGSRVSAA